MTGGKQYLHIVDVFMITLPWYQKQHGVSEGKATAKQGNKNYEGNKHDTVPMDDEEM